MGAAPTPAPPARRLPISLPFIDTHYFQFAYGDTSANERIIDSQYVSSTIYVGSSQRETLIFGVNFADGRIKGYCSKMRGQDKTFFVQCVRGNPAYGKNVFHANGDGTVTDRATGLMWSQADSGEGMNWETALAWVQKQNAAKYLGHSGWRLPSVKELQSLVDYTRSPETTHSAAIDPIFNCTTITNGARQADYHYVDVHGAGAQRSDPKVGDPAKFPHGRGPQGDVISIYN